MSKITTSIVTFHCTPRIIDMQQITALLNMIWATEQDVDLFEWDFARFRDEEPDEDCEADVYAREEPECVAVSC